MKFYLCATNCSEYLGDNGRYDANKIPEGAHIEWYKDDRGYHDEMYVELQMCIRDSLHAGSEADL